MLGDTHIYNNHISQCEELIKRKPKDSPILSIVRQAKNIDDFKYEDFKVENYDPHPTIKGEMAI
jgi:thymidylate synthase